jgi:hypothetical protein
MTFIIAQLNPIGRRLGDVLLSRVPSGSSWSDWHIAVWTCMCEHVETFSNKINRDKKAVKSIVQLN